MQGIRLDQHALQIQFAEQLPQQRPLVTLAGSSIAGYTDLHTQSGGIQRHLGNERGSPTGCGLSGAQDRLAVTHKLIEILCTTWDLDDRPFTDRSTQGHHINLAEEVAESGIRERSPEVAAQRESGSLISKLPPRTLRVIVSAV